MTKEEEKVLKEFLRMLLNQHIDEMVWEWSTWSSNETPLKDVIRDILKKDSDQNVPKEELVVNVVCKFLGCSPNTLVDAWDKTIK